VLSPVPFLLRPEEGRTHWKSPSSSDPVPNRATLFLVFRLRSQRAVLPQGRCTCVKLRNFASFPARLTFSSAPRRFVRKEAAARSASSEQSSENTHALGCFLLRRVSDHISLCAESRDRPGKEQHKLRLAIEIAMVLPPRNNAPQFHTGPPFFEAALISCAARLDRFG